MLSIFTSIIRSSPNDHKTQNIEDVVRGHPGSQQEAGIEPQSVKPDERDGRVDILGLIQFWGVEQ
jgi:hypothetical protein